jgi:MFS family permease
LGLFIPFTFIILEATAKGMGASLAGYLVSILNAASVFGRTLPAHVADRYVGRFNILITMAITTTVLVLGMWIPASSNAALVVFAALFGFTSGSIVSITPALVAQISDVRQIGVRTGTIFTIVSIAVLISNPIAGALVTADHGGFLKLQVFAGAVMVGGCFFLVLARIKLAGLQLTTKV